MGRVCKLTKLLPKKRNTTQKWRGLELGGGGNTHQPCHTNSQTRQVQNQQSLPSQLLYSSRSGFSQRPSFRGLVLCLSSCNIHFFHLCLHSSDTDCNLVDQIISRVWGQNFTYSDATIWFLNLSLLYPSLHHKFWTHPKGLGHMASLSPGYNDWRAPAQAEKR